MAERNKARLRDVDAKRREARWKAHGLTAPADHVDSRAQVQREWQETCEDRGWPAHAVDDKEMRSLFVTHRRKQRERARLSKITEQRKAVRQATGPSGRKRGRPRDPNREQRKQQQKQQRADDVACAQAGPAAACALRQWFANAGKHGFRGHGRLDHFSPYERQQPRGWPKAVIWWRRVAQQQAARAANSAHSLPERSAAAAYARAAIAKAEVEMVVAEAAAPDTLAQARAAALQAIASAAAAAHVSCFYVAHRARGRLCDDNELRMVFERAWVDEGILDALPVSDAMETAFRLPPLRSPPPSLQPSGRAWSTRGAVRRHHSLRRALQGAQEQQVRCGSAAALWRALLRAPPPGQVHRGALRWHEEAWQGPVPCVERLMLQRRCTAPPWQPLLPPSPYPLRRTHTDGHPLRSNELV